MEPIRCYTCNAVLRFKQFEELTLCPESTGALDAFRTMGVSRFCCRRMYLGHPRDMEEHIRSFALRNATRGSYEVQFEVDGVREVSTD